MKKLLVLGALAITGLSNAAIFSYSVAGDVESWDDEGSPFNFTDSINLGVGSTVTGIGWNVNLTTVGASWLSEMMVSFADGSNAPGLYVTPGFGDDFSGANTNYTSGGILDLTDNSIPDIVLSSGNLNLEFFEFYDDVTGSVDGYWVDGTIDIQYTPVPEPATMAVLGLGAAALIRRRRK